MRPARIIAAVSFAATVALTGCAARSTADRSTAAPQTPGSTTAPTTTPPSTTSASGGRSAPGRCQTSALGGSVQGTDGAAGTIWYIIQLRNVSGGTCTVKGIPQVRLLGAQGQPVTAPSQPGGPGGSLVALRPGQAASFAFGEPNVCDSTVAGSRLRVTLPQGQGWLVVELDGEAQFGTCSSVQVRALEPAAG